MNDKEPWFRSYIFAFWVIPVHWKGWIVASLMLISTCTLLYLMLDIFENGSVGQYICSALYIVIAGAGLMLMHVHTEKHKG